jgi:hypothetical protein
MTMKQYAKSEWVSAIIRDLDEEKHEAGFIHTTEYGATILCCDPKTVSNLLESGNFNTGHIDLMLKNTKATNLKSLLLKLSKESAQ